MKEPKLIDYTLLGILSLIWASAFFNIKIATESFGPVTIAFLRVFVRKSKVLILDEATSSIDTNTEVLLQNALRKLSYNRTTIIIAHRLSTISHADKIVYLKDGQIAEQGNHSALIKKKGLYFKMYTAQFDDN